MPFVNVDICPFDFAKVMNEGIKGSRIVQFHESGHGLDIEEKQRRIKN